MSDTQHIVEHEIPAFLLKRPVCSGVCYFLSFQYRLVSIVVFSHWSHSVPTASPPNFIFSFVWTFRWTTRDIATVFKRSQVYTSRKRKILKLFLSKYRKWKLKNAGWRDNHCMRFYGFINAIRWQLNFTVMSVNWYTPWNNKKPSGEREKKLCKLNMRIQMSWHAIS